MPGARLLGRHNLRMLLLLVRHAIACAHDPVSWPDDRDRPLTPLGQKKFRGTAKGLGSLVPSVDVVLSSPLRRTWQTALILHRKAGWPSPRPLEELAPGPSSDALLGALASQSAAQSMALVGHQPGLEKLVSYLLSGETNRVRVALKKGGVACLETDDTPAPGAATLRWLMTPAQLGAIGLQAGHPTSH